MGRRVVVIGHVCVMGMIYVLVEVKPFFFVADM